VIVGQILHLEYNILSFPPLLIFQLRVYKICTCWDLPANKAGKFLSHWYY